MTTKTTTQKKPTPVDVNIIPKAFDSNSLFLMERDKELTQIMYAMLLGEHVFLQGEAGTAKSLLARHAFKLIEDSKMFSIQMSEATLSENLFGAYDITAWKKNGVFVRDITGSILEADFVFIDEIFDAREDILRTLLGILNERTFSEGRQQETAKLHTCIATANYQEINEKTIPVLDRFLFKSIVSPVKSKYNRVAMYKNHLKKKQKLGDYTIKPILTLEQLQTITDNIYNNTIKFNDNILKAYDYMLTEYTKEIKQEKDKYVSPRTSNKLLDIVKASALLNNRKEATYSDLAEVKYGLCTMNDTKDEMIFDRVYEKCVARYEKEIEQLDKLTQIEKDLKLDQFRNIELQPNEYVSRMKVLKVSLEKLKTIKSQELTPNTTQRTDALLKKVSEVYEESKKKFFVKNKL